MKRIVIPILFLFVCLFNVSCHREQPKIQDENEEPIQLFSYSVQPNGEIAITGLTVAGKACTEISIPETIEDKPVTIIDSVAFSGCNNLDSIKIPQSIKRIGHQAFSCCPNLTGITVSDLNEQYSTRDGLLYNKNQTKLFCCPEGRKGEIILPDGLTEISEDAFESCIGLTDITASDLNGQYSSIEGILYNKEQTKLLCCPEGKNGEIVIPDSVISIEESAFVGCTSITSIIVSSNNNFQMKIFDECTNLEHVYDSDKNELLASNFTYIINDFGAFITELTKKGSRQSSLVIPERLGGSPVIAIDQEICAGQLISITIPDSISAVTKLDGNFDLLSNTDTESVSYWPMIFENSTRSNIFHYLFENCSYLTEIKVYPGSAKYSSVDGVLYNKEQTTLIYCPRGKKGELTIPDTVMEIGKFAFYNSNLTKINIKNGILVAGSLAKTKSEIYLGEGVTRVEADCFGITKDELSLKQFYSMEIYGPPDLERIADQFPDIHISKDNQDYCDIDGVVFNKDKTRLVLCSGNKEGEYSIPDTVKEVSDYAFAGCFKLQKIIITENVINIGQNIFADCEGLNDITVLCSKMPDFDFFADKYIYVPYDYLGHFYIIEESWRYNHLRPATARKLTIGEKVINLSPLWLIDLRKREWLFTEINISDNNPYYCCLDGIVYNREKTKIIFCSPDKEGKYIVPDTVEEIGGFAFYGSTLQEISIPPSVTNLEKSTFAGSSFDVIRMPMSVFSKYKKIYSSDVIGYKDERMKNILEDDLFYLYDIAMYPEPDLPVFSSSPRRICVARENKTTLSTVDIFSCKSEDLVRLEINNSMTIIPSDLFTSCLGFNILTMPDSVKSIEAYAFAGCRNLEEITISSNINNIGYKAFDGCEKLGRIISRNPEPPILAPKVFGQCPSLSTIEVPFSAINAYKSAEGWSEYAEKIVGY